MNVKFLIGVKGSVAVCTSPLTAIMIEQIAKFNYLGITAEFVSEGQSDAGAQRRVLNGEAQIILSPENVIQNPVYRNMLLSPVYKHKMFALVVVDEAHCVRSWLVVVHIVY